EPQEQERGKQPFSNPQEPGSTAHAENGIHPGKKRTVADKWKQCVRLVLEPFLIPKEQKDEHHRCPDQVVIEVALEEPGLRQLVDERVHWLLLAGAATAPRWRRAFAVPRDNTLHWREVVSITHQAIERHDGGRHGVSFGWRGFRQDRVPPEVDPV